MEIVMTIVIAIGSLTARWFDWSHCELTSYWNHMEPDLVRYRLMEPGLGRGGLASASPTARRQGLLKVQKRRNAPCLINQYG